MDLPKKFTQSPWYILDSNDSAPSNIDQSTIAWIGGFLSTPLASSTSNPRATGKSLNDGAGVSLLPVYPEATWDQEWTIVETVLLRLDTDSTPSGHFPVHAVNSFSSPSPTTVRTGYDAAVCVQKYEPWITETYNTSIVSPSTLRIVEKGNGSTSLLPSGNIQGAPIENTRYLNATGKNAVFIYAHENSIGGIIVTNNDWIAGNYRPTPIVGPTVPPRTTFLLTSTNSTGGFFHQWHWTPRIHRTLPRPARRHPRTG